MEEQFDQCTTALMTASEARSAEQARLRAARSAPPRSPAEGCLRERYPPLNQQRALAYVFCPHIGTQQRLLADIGGVRHIGLVPDGLARFAR